MGGDEEGKLRPDQNGDDGERKSLCRGGASGGQAVGMLGESAGGKKGKRGGSERGGRPVRRAPCRFFLFSAGLDAVGRCFELSSSRPRNSLFPCVVTYAPLAKDPHLFACTFELHTRTADSHCTLALHTLTLKLPTLPLRAHTHHTHHTQ